MNANRMKLLLKSHTKMFESRISAVATEKIARVGKLHTTTVAWSHDMEEHVQKCVERYCVLANKSLKSLLTFNKQHCKTRQTSQPKETCAGHEKKRG